MIDNKMHEHSRAKIELYGIYLSIFLQIISRDKKTDKIYIFDLFCGQGKYDDGQKGSAVVLLETIKNHYFANGQKSPAIEIVFNDYDKNKIKALKTEADKIYRPENCTVQYESKSYEEIIPETIEKVEKLAKNEKAVILLDPYGYKHIKFEHILKLLIGCKAEILLFLPASRMYQFVSVNKNAPGSEPLQRFLNELFGNNLPVFNSPFDFINKVKEAYRNKFNQEGEFYIDNFILERGAANIYSLFFFSSHIRGAEKMLEAKWKLDQEQGRGFRTKSSEETQMLFSPLETSNLDEIIKKYIAEKGSCTNRELYKLGILNGFLPTQMFETMEMLKKSGKLKIETIDKEKKLPSRGFYINYENYILEAKLKFSMK